MHHLHRAVMPPSMQSRRGRLRLVFLGFLMCGEQMRRLSSVDGANGSSPRVWGTVGRARGDCPGRRFIPTRVGNSSRRLTPTRSPPVHPHACGEQIDKAFLGNCTLGSSPRVWGTGARRASASVRRRFIPTRVGNRGREHVRARLDPVHPHACGEQDSPGILTGVTYGSSPRVWGTGVPLLDLWRKGRFIPTRVGNRRSCGSVSSASTVHPHACGEQRSCAGRRRGWSGSSPRVWGTAPRRLPPGSALRFIPTRVGNSQVRSQPSAQSPVHPHACGEQHDDRRGRAGRGGSSPRVWGTVDVRCSPLTARRFIPTRVGNSASGPLCAAR